MATTALRIPKDGAFINMLFMTVQRPDGNCDVDIFVADENFEPAKTPSLGICEKSEEDYHRNLRIDAIMQGHFVQDYSTNPEWNPDYVDVIDGEYPDFPTEDGRI